MRCSNAVSLSGGLPEKARSLRHGERAPHGHARGCPEWQDRAGREGKRRRAGRLERPSTPIVLEAKLVSNMRGERVSRRESLSCRTRTPFVGTSAATT